MKRKKTSKMAAPTFIYGSIDSSGTHFHFDQSHSFVNLLIHSKRAEVRQSRSALGTHPNQTTKNLALASEVLSITEVISITWQLAWEQRLEQLGSALQEQRDRKSCKRGLCGSRYRSSCGRDP